MNFNKVFLMGHLTRDPEMRYTPKGTAITSFGMAVNRTWKTESGETKEEVTFVDMTCFGRMAEVASQYLKKGAPLFVEGRLRLEQWEDKQTNQKRQKISIAVEGFQFLGGKRDGTGGATPASRTSPSESSAPASESASGSEAPQPPEDDVPF